MSTPSPVPTLSPRASLNDLAHGLVLPLRAVASILRSPRLVALALLGSAVTAVTLIGLGVLLWSLCQDWGSALVGDQGTLAEVGAFAVGVVLFVITYATAALTVPNLLLSPLVDPLSEAAEALFGGPPPPPFSLSRMLRGTFESVAHTALRVGLMGLGYLVLAPLNLIPAVGSAAWVALSSGWAMYWLSVEHLSNPMARHLYRFGQVVTALRRRPLLALGFGASLYVLLWVPVVNFLLMPVAVVAGTILYRAMLPIGALDPPSGTR